MSTQPTTQTSIISTPALNPETATEFTASIRGAVLQMGDPGYDEARRLQNELINRHPAMIVRCSGTASPSRSGAAGTMSPAAP
jgi:hypothetical protein